MFKVLMDRSPQPAASDHLPSADAPAPPHERGRVWGLKGRRNQWTLPPSMAHAKQRSSVKGGKKTSSGRIALLVCRLETNTNNWLVKLASSEKNKSLSLALGREQLLCRLTLGFKELSFGEDQHPVTDMLWRDFTHLAIACLKQNQQKATTFGGPMAPPCLEPQKNGVQKRPTQKRATRQDIRLKQMASWVPCRSQERLMALSCKSVAWWHARVSKVGPFGGLLERRQQSF